jgi:hypothetical protein
MSEQHGDESGPGRSAGWSGDQPPTIDVTPHEEAPASPAHGRRLWPVLILVAAVVIVLGTAPYWTKYLPWSPEKAGEAAKARLGEHDTQLAALAQQQRALDQRLGRVEQQLKTVATPQWMQEEATAMRALADRVAALEHRAPPPGDQQQLAALGADLKKLAATTTELQQRLDRLSARGEAAAGRRSDQALLLAVGQLRAAAARGRSFAAELATAKSLAGTHPELAQALNTLGDAAATGAPSEAALAQRFKDEVAPALARPRQAPAEPAEGGIGARIVAKLRSLVVIRRVGEAAPTSDPVAAAVAKAETALAGGDLAGAVSAVESLSDKERVAAQSWLAAAQRRLAIDQTLDQIDGRLTAELAAAPAPEATPAARAAPPAAAPASQAAH